MMFKYKKLKVIGQNASQIDKPLMKLIKKKKHYYALKKGYSYNIEIL